jgi:hypothetical protein
MTPRRVAACVLIVAIGVIPSYASAQRRGGGGGGARAGGAGGARAGAASRPSGGGGGFNLSRDTGPAISGGGANRAAAQSAGANRSNLNAANVNRNTANVNRNTADVNRNNANVNRTANAANVNRNTANVTRNVSGNTVNVNRTVVANPVYHGPAWGWNRGAVWAPAPAYYGGGFWGALAISAASAATAAAVYGSITNSATHQTYTSYQVQPNSPGSTLLSNYGLTQTQCGPPNLVVIYGPSNSVICAIPNSRVTAGSYTVDPATLSIVSQ